MKKVNGHRKRFPPPGPCGVWWRQQRQLRGNKNDTTGSANINGVSASYPQKQAPSTFSTGYNLPRLAPSQSTQQIMTNDGSLTQRRSKSENDITYSDGWSSMLQSLNIATPYLNPSDPPHKKYQLIRKHVPQETLKNLFAR